MDLTWFICTPQHNTVWRCCWEAQGFPRCLVLTFHREVMAAQPHVRQKRPIFTFVSALNTQGVWLVRGKHFFYHKRLKYFSQCTSDCQCQYGGGVIEKIFQKLEQHHHSSVIYFKRNKVSHIFYYVCGNNMHIAEMRHLRFRGGGKRKPCKLCL